MSAVSLVLFFAQRSFLFPVPTTARTAPQAAGFPEAEEHVLTTADGEKVIVWHVPARPGRPVVLYFHGNGDFLAGFFGRFREHHRRRDRGRRAVLSRLCRLERAAERAADCCRMPRRPMPSRRRDIARTASSSGAFRSAPALRWRWRRSSRIGKLILEAPYTSIADVAASLFWFAPVRLLMRDQFRSDAAHRAGQGSAADHAWRARSRDPDRLWRAAVCAGARAEAVRPLSRRRS